MSGLLVALVTAQVVTGYPQSWSMGAMRVGRVQFTGLLGHLKMVGPPEGTSDLERQAFRIDLGGQTEITIFGSSSHLGKDIAARPDALAAAVLHGKAVAGYVTGQVYYSHGRHSGDPPDWFQIDGFEAQMDNPVTAATFSKGAVSLQGRVTVASRGPITIKKSEVSGPNGGRVLLSVTPHSVTVHSAEVALGNSTPLRLHAHLASEAKTTWLLDLDRGFSLLEGALSGEHAAVSAGTGSASGVTLSIKKGTAAKVRVVAAANKLEVGVQDLRLTATAVSHKPMPVITATPRSLVSVAALHGGSKEQGSLAVLEPSIENLSIKSAKLSLALENGTPAVDGDGTATIVYEDAKQLTASVAIESPTLPLFNNLSKAIALRRLTANATGLKAKPVITGKIELAKLILSSLGVEAPATGSFSFDGHDSVVIGVHAPSGTVSWTHGDAGARTLQGSLGAFAIIGAVLHLPNKGGGGTLELPTNALGVTVLGLTSLRETLMKGTVMFPTGVELTNPGTVAIAPAIGGRIRLKTTSLAIEHAKATCDVSGTTVEIGKVATAHADASMPGGVLLAATSVARGMLAANKSAAVDADLQSGALTLAQGVFEDDNVTFDAEHYQASGLDIGPGKLHANHIAVEASDTQTRVGFEGLTMIDARTIHHDGAPFFEGTLVAGASIGSGFVLSPVGENALPFDQFSFDNVDVNITSASYRDESQIRFGDGTAHLTFAHLSRDSADGHLTLNNATTTLHEVSYDAALALRRLDVEFSGKKSALGGTGTIAVDHFTFAMRDSPLKLNDSCTLPINISGSGPAASGAMALVAGKVQGTLAIPTGNASLSHMGSFSCNWPDHIPMPSLRVLVYPCPTWRKPWRVCTVAVKVPGIPLRVQLDVHSIGAAGQLANAQLRFNKGRDGLQACGGNLQSFQLTKHPPDVTISAVPIGGVVGSALLSIEVFVNRFWQTPLGELLGDGAALLRNAGIGPTINVLGNCS